MIVKYNKLDRFEKPFLLLCNPGAQFIQTGVDGGNLTRVIGALNDYDSEEIIFNFNATSELNFRLYKINRELDPDNRTEREYTERLYRMTQNRRLIYVKDIGFFVITDITESFDGHTNYKDVSAKSVDVEIEQKMLPYIEDGTYPFLTYYEHEGLLNKIVSCLPLWTIGFVAPAVEARWRTFEDVGVDLNCLSFFLQNMQDAYECIFVFDITTRTINVYDQNNYVVQTNIHLTKDDLINSLNIQENSADIYTALTVTGGENVMIGAVNPLGTNTIYDFSYYLSWMTEPLAEKVEEWQEDVDSYKSEYNNLNLSYYNKLQQCSNKTLEIQRLNTQLTIYKRLRENLVAGASYGAIESYNDVIDDNGGTRVEIYDEGVKRAIEDIIDDVDGYIQDCLDDLDSAQQDLDQYNDDLDDIQDAIDAIVNSLSFQTYFTQSQYEELSYYIFEGSYNDEYVTITDSMTYPEQFEQMNTLYDRAVSQLKKVSKPSQQFDVDVENFVFEKEFAHWSEQLETGCLINVELDDNDVAPLFLSNITINYDDHNLTMTFGNRFNKFDPKTLFENVLGGVNKSANSINYLKETVYPIKNTYNTMREQIQASRDLTMDAALASENQEVTIDGAGYTGREVLANGEYDPRQVKITGKSIVFTDDAWESCKVAIGELIVGGQSTYGVNAETIIGDLIIGNQLVIKDNQGNDLFTIMDGRVQSTVTSMGLNSAVTDTRVFYCVKNEGTIPLEDDPSWSAAYPSRNAGQCIWKKTQVKHANSSTYITQSIENITGDHGDDGVSGRSVVNIYFEYALCGSEINLTDQIEPGNETLPGDNTYASVAEWDIVPQEYIEGYVYWRRSVTTYSDGEVEYGTPVPVPELVSIWTKVGYTATQIDQTNERISLWAQKITTVEKEMGDLGDDYEKLEEHIAGIEVDAEKITAEVARRVTDGISSELTWAKQWLDENGVHVKTSASATETLIDGTGFEVREVDPDSGDVVNTVMLVKDGSVEAAKLQANDTFTYYVQPQGSQRGYMSIMKVYESSVDLVDGQPEKGIGWYWRESEVS